MRRSQEATYLVGKNQTTQEDTFAGPLLKGNLQMGLGAVDVDEHDQNDWEFDLCLLEDIGNKLCKLCVFVDP